MKHKSTKETHEKKCCGCSKENHGNEDRLTQGQRRKWVWVVMENHLVPPELQLYNPLLQVSTPNVRNGFLVWRH